MQEYKAKLEQKIREKELIKQHFISQIEKQSLELSNGRYLKLLNKLARLESDLGRLKVALSAIKRSERLDRRIFVAINSRVKLVALDLEITLWVDARNVTDVLGKRLGEIVDLYNSQFRIAAIY